MSAPLGFLDLPAETRLLIYDYISSEGSSIVNQPLSAAAAMLHTCKTIHDELLVSLYSSKLVVLDGHANALGAKDPAACQQPNKALLQLSLAARESVKDVSYKIFAWQGDSPIEPAEEIDLVQYIVVSGKADKRQASRGRQQRGVQSLQKSMDMVSDCPNVRTLNLPARLHTIHVFSPASVCPEARGPQHRVPLRLSHDLISSLQLPNQQALVKVSGAPGDERWVYELTSLEHKGGEKH